MPNPFVHIELNTSDLKKAKKFYQSLFDWKFKDMPGAMPYTMIDVGTGTGGGMFVNPMTGAPVSWLPYVAVDDVKKTIAKAAKGGAQIMVEYMPIGGGMGAFGVMIDPMGAALGVWEMAKKAPAAKKVAKKAAKKAPAKKAAKKTAAKKKR